MALGDQTLAAGWATVNPNTDLVKDGADEITETRDMAASVKLETRPVTRGGTGATTASQALKNLGIYVQATDPGHANGRVWIRTP
ncbi:hypothetical protein [Microbacterium hydrocarbonoxydans]|uniref:hypothetical protein n=1 Tax=Microbacterium hydrocarbonoxydans TaxID=273678 RepID=UPI00203EC1C1|nr:hypothetical protein [Microbacterium hydrocarbonoxydans]MCM3778993.1 hypothetical protein [Microbacterium hydrocarbonoxydans]